MSHRTQITLTDEQGPAALSDPLTTNSLLGPGRYRLTTEVNWQ